MPTANPVAPNPRAVVLAMPGVRPADVNRVMKELRAVEGEPPDGIRRFDRLDAREKGLFLASAREGSFRGLFIALLSQAQSDVLFDLLTRHRYIVTLQLARQNKDVRRPVSELLELIELAELVCRSKVGGRALLVVHDPSRPRAGAWANRVDRTPLSFQVTAYRDVNPKALGTVLAGKKLRLEPFLVSADADRPQTQKYWGEFTFSDDRESRLWIHQEFDSVAVRRAYEQLASTVSSDRVLLEALRLSRFLATRNLEGHPFRCTVCLLSEEEFNRETASGSSFIRLFMFDKSIFFNLAPENVSEVATHAEVIQGEDLAMLVAAEDGRVRCIAARSSAKKYDRTTHRRKYLASASKPGTYFQVLPHGKVEVYHDGRFLLWFDGFSWVAEPLSDVVGRLEEWFRGKADQEPIEKILGAIGLLVDRQQASILVFPKDASDAGIARGCMQSLREDLTPLDQIYVGHLSIEAIAGLIRVDGAHMIDRTGRLISFAWLIESNSESKGSRRTKTKGSGKAKGKGPGRQSGAGGSSARQLASALRRDSFVIKVSASGPIRVFPGESQ